MHKTMMILLLGGLSANAALALDNAVTVKLEALNDSGESGTATLVPEGDQTRVVIKLSNAPKDVAQPVHIHLGQCDKLDKKPKWPLESLMNGKSETLVPASLAAIQKESSAINVHKSRDDIQTYVSCGDIPHASSGGY